TGPATGKQGRACHLTGHPEPDWHRSDFQGNCIRPGLRSYFPGPSSPCCHQRQGAWEGIWCQTVTGPAFFLFCGTTGGAGVYRFRGDSCCHTGIPGTVNPGLVPAPCPARSCHPGAAGSPAGDSLSSFRPQTEKTKAKETKSNTLQELKMNTGEN